MITIYGKPSCGYCGMAKTLCETKSVEYTYKQLGEDYTADEFQELFPAARTFPQITNDEATIGGFNELRDYFEAQGV